MASSRRDAASRCDDGIVKAVVERLPAEVHSEIHGRLPFLKRLVFASILGATGYMLRPEAPWLILPGQSEVIQNKAMASCFEEEEELSDCFVEPEENAMASFVEEEEELSDYYVVEPEEEPMAVDKATELSKEKAAVLSMKENKSTAVRVPDLAMLDRVIIGSAGGWLVTADERGVLRMANPATGAQAALPAIDTIPFLSSSGHGKWFILDVKPFLQVRFGGAPPPDDKDWGPYPPRSSTLTAEQMRQRFYRKVVLSSSPRPGSYTAMLMTDKHIGAPAFATAADPAWRMARSPGGVEDAIYHDGRFYSVSYAGNVEAWQRDVGTGEFTSRVVAPRLAYDDKHLRRKYLAASPDGQLMAVLKHSELQVENEDNSYYRRSTITRVSFEVQVLDQAGRWSAATDIGDAALFVGVNMSMCVSTREHPRIMASCVYFTDDEIGDACLRHAQGTKRDHYRDPDETELRETCVYGLKHRRVIDRITEKGPLWPPPAWFMPSFL